MIHHTISDLGNIYSSSIVIISSILPLNARSPIASILSLVNTVTHVAICFITGGIEFSGFSILIIRWSYSCIVLFVIMMLNVKLVYSRTSALNYIPLGAIASTITMIQSVYFTHYDFSFIEPEINMYYKVLESSTLHNKLVPIALVLIVFDSLPLSFIGYTSLIAMVGAIAPAFHHDSYTKRQNILLQNLRLTNMGLYKPNV